MPDRRLSPRTRGRCVMKVGLRGGRELLYGASMGYITRRAIVRMAGQRMWTSLGPWRIENLGLSRAGQSDWRTQPRGPAPVQEEILRW